jgi:hypothetical protein
MHSFILLELWSKNVSLSVSVIWKSSTIGQCHVDHHSRLHFFFAYLLTDTAAYLISDLELICYRIRYTFTEIASTVLLQQCHMVSQQHYLLHKTVGYT